MPILVLFLPLLSDFNLVIGHLLIFSYACRKFGIEEKNTSLRARILVLPFAHFWVLGSLLGPHQSEFLPL